MDLIDWVGVGLGGNYCCRCGTTPAAICWWDVNGFVDSSVGCECGSYWLGSCGVRSNLWLQVWYLICSYVGGSILCGFG